MLQHICDCHQDSSTGVNISNEGLAIPACIGLSSIWDSRAFCCGVGSFNACPMPGLRHRRSELKEQIQNDTNTRMTRTSGNSIRSVDSQMVLGGRGVGIGLQTPDGLTLPWLLGGKRDGGVSSSRKTMRKEDLLELVSILSSLSTAFRCLGQVAWWIFLLSALGFFLWSHAVLWSQVVSPVPLCFPSVKHIIKTHSFQKVIYTLIRLHVKYLGIFQGKQ